MNGASEAIMEAAMAALRKIEGLSGVFEAGPVQAADCHASVEAGAETDWSHKSGVGRELRIAVTVRAGGERSARVRALADAVEAALAALAGEHGGWRIVTMQLLRVRTLREGKSGWAALVEFRVRMLKA